MLSVSVDGILFLVEGEYTPGTQDKLYCRNGDPGEPGDPAELEIESIWLGDQDITEFLTPEQTKKIQESAEIKAVEEYDQDDERGYDVMDALKDRQLIDVRNLYE